MTIKYSRYRIKIATRLPLLHLVREDWALVIVFIIGTAFWFIHPQVFIAEDSYFYLTIARNLVTSGQLTFNNLYITNGYHPLWLLILGIYFKLISPLNSNILFYPVSIVPISALILGFSTFIFFRVTKLLRIQSFFTVMIPLSFLITLGVLGSEAHLNFFSFALLLYCSISEIRQKSYGAVAIGVALAAVFLSRLDNIFLIFAYLIWFISTEHKRRRIFVVLSVSSILVVPYILSNLMFFGDLFPISGWLKTSFPILTPKELPFSHGLTLDIWGIHLILGVLPLILSTLLLLGLRREIRGNLTILWPIWVGGVLNALYVVLFTTGYTLWAWYYVTPISLFGLTIGIILSKLRLKKIHKSYVILIALVVNITVLVLDKGQALDSGEPTILVNYLTRNKIKQASIMVSEFPGTAAYYTENHIIAADLLTSNRFFYDELRRSDNALTFIRDFAREQGHALDYIVYVGGGWLVPTENYTEVIYHDPKQFPEHVELGRLYVGNPIFIDEGGKLIVWQLQP